MTDLRFSEWLHSQGDLPCEFHLTDDPDLVRVIVNEFSYLVRLDDSPECDALRATFQSGALTTELVTRESRSVTDKDGFRCVSNDANYITFFRADE